MYKSTNTPPKVSPVNDYLHLIVPTIWSRQRGNVGLLSDSDFVITSILYTCIIHAFFTSFFFFTNICMIHACFIRFFFKPIYVWFMHVSSDLFILTNILYVWFMEVSFLSFFSLFFSSTNICRIHACFIRFFFFHQYIIFMEVSSDSFLTNILYVWFMHVLSDFFPPIYYMYDSCMFHQILFKKTNICMIYACFIRLFF